MKWYSNISTSKPTPFLLIFLAVHFSLNRYLSLKCFKGQNFSVKRSLQTTLLGVPWTIDIIFHFMLGVIFSSFNFHLYSESSVLLKFFFGENHSWSVIQSISNNHDRICRNRVEGPIDNKCLTASIVYKAVLLAPSKPDEKYFGIAEITFKSISETTQKISSTKSTLAALNFLN